MHRPSDTAEFVRQDETAASIAIAVPDSPTEEISPDEQTEEPTTRRSDTFAGPVELLAQYMPLVLCEAPDPDEEEEEDDLDYLYDDEDEDLDDDLDEDLDEFEEEEEEFEEDDEEL